MASSRRYFSAAFGQSSDIAPENEGPLISEVATIGRGLQADDSEINDEQPPLRRHFPSKKLNKRPEAAEDDTYADPAPVDKDLVKKYSRGTRLNLRGIRTGFHKQKFAKKRQLYNQRAVQAARAELLLPEEAGFIQPDDDDGPTSRITQKEIASSVDVLSATKHFQLDLPSYGPYCCDYTRNGRNLLLGGRKMHVAAVDWLTKDLICEINVMETVRDVKWLHNETIFAVAQKRWTYLYDRKGTELHCLKSLFQTRRLEFLPYHFLLVSATSVSFLHWLDVSMGKLVRSTFTKQGPLDVMCTNPVTAVTHIGSTRGTVSLWSPNVKEPLVKILCHGSPVRGLAVDNTGTYMTTSGADGMLRLWDLRKYGNLHTYKLPRVAEPLALSQRRLLAAGVGTQAQIFHDPFAGPVVRPYLVHDCHEMITSVQFCPFEDVLGVGHRSGFVSMLIPGSGEPNFDAFEANPYQSKKQRKEEEVKRLLDKIQPEMITLDADLIGRVDCNALERKLDEKLKILYLKPPKIEIDVKHKTKGKGGAASKVRRKQAVREQKQREHLRQQRNVRKELLEDGVLEDDESQKTTTKKRKHIGHKSALDRFEPKK